MDLRHIPAVEVDIPGDHQVHHFRGEILRGIRGVGEEEDTRTEVAVRDMRKEAFVRPGGHRLRVAPERRPAAVGAVRVPRHLRVGVEV